MACACSRISPLTGTDTLAAAGNRSTHSTNGSHPARGDGNMTPCDRYSELPGLIGLVTTKPFHQLAYFVSRLSPLETAWILRSTGITLAYIDGIL